MSKPFHILFMCVANSARSQLAEGLARSVFGPEARIQSAGSQPGTLNPYAVKVMKEMGLDISHHYSKSVQQLESGFIEKLDYIITLCAEEVCPVMVAPKAQKLHWPFADPASKEKLSDDEMLGRFRTARDGILKSLKEFQTKTLS